MMKKFDYKELIKHITTFIFDYDGVLSDGKVFVSDDGNLLRSGYVKDGYIIQLALKLNYKIAVISGSESNSLLLRCKLLKIEDIFLGATNKIKVYEKYKKDNNLTDEEILYIGDDIPDYEVMQKVGVACCPSNAASEIKEISHYVSHYKGGEGCVREVIEMVMRAQNKWFSEEALHW